MHRRQGATGSILDQYSDLLAIECDRKLKFLMKGKLLSTFKFFEFSSIDATIWIF